MKMIKTRFAPSPTGSLHIGGVRTALYAWLFARKHGGSFILRIEDTDQERSTQASVQSIISALTWLGLNWDEGPYYQTHRLARYQAVLEKLLQAGKAYRCYCSKERLETLRAEQMSRQEKPRYDGKCRHDSPRDTTQPPVIRFKNPTEGVVSFEDCVRGSITIANQELDDLILARSDGMPTYNFCVVVDDLEMEITHVLRGDDHINNTPRQINLFYALGATPPVYGHMPTILGADGKRLSKRHGALDVNEYHEQGYLPEAVLNYLLRLGWSHGDQEIFSRAEMIAKFDLEHMSKSPAMFNPEKLLWLNQHYLKTLPVEELVPLLKEQLLAQGITTEHGPDLKLLILSQRERTKTLQEMAEKSRFFYEDFPVYNSEAVTQQLTSENLPILEKVLTTLTRLSIWTEASLKEAIQQLTEELALKLGKIAQPVRVAVSGNTISPPLETTLYLLSKERVLSRLQKAIFLCAS